MSPRVFFDGARFWLVLKRKSQEHCHFGGPLKERYTHMQVFSFARSEKGQKSDVALFGE